MNEQEPSEKQIGKHLKGLEDDLSAETRSKLAAARNRALDQLTPQKGPLFWRPQLFGALALAVIALLVFVFFNAQTVEQMPDIEGGDFLAAQELELLEDLEFAAWVVMLEESDEPAQG